MIIFYLKSIKILAFFGIILLPTGVLLRGVLVGLLLPVVDPGLIEVYQEYRAHLLGDGIRNL